MELLLSEEEKRGTSVLQTFLAPYIHLRIARRRARKASKRGKEKYALPTVAALRAQPFFTKWSDGALAAVLDESTLVCPAEGKCVSLAGEPASSAAVFYVIAGRLSEVPTKAEIMSCVAEAASLSHCKEPKTGPLVFPSLFAAPGAPAAATASLCQRQDEVVDSLIGFAPGQLVGLEALALGDCTRRAVRCQSAHAALLRVPFTAVAAQLVKQPADVRRASLACAASTVEGWLLRAGDRPSIQDILRRCPVTRGLSDLTMRAVWRQLAPRVFRANDTIAADSYEAETVFFLRRGSVRVADGSHASTVTAAGASVGLNAVIACDVPSPPEAPITAKALAYCELWGIGAQALRGLCTDGDRESCTRLSADMLRAAGERLLRAEPLLRQIAAFSLLPDGAVRALGQALVPRVYAPGSWLTPAAGKKLKGGLIVLAGSCVYVAAPAAGKARGEGKGEQQRVPVRRGEPLLFSEALARRACPRAVYAETSAIALFGGTGRMLDTLEDAGCTPEEVQRVLDVAATHADSTCGRAHDEMPEAQQQAAKRVAQHRLQLRRDLKERAAVGPGAAAADADAGLRREELVLKNELVTSLAMRIQFLHPTEDEVAQEEYLRSVKGAVADDTRAEGEKRYRQRSCFTLDPAGNLVFSDTYPPASCGRGEEGAGEDDNDHKGGGDARSDDEGRGATPRFTPSPPAIRALPLSAPPSLQRASATEPREDLPPWHLRSANLRRPEHERRYGPPKRVPPRLAAMRQAVSSLKDEVDGIDRRTEYKKQMLRYGGAKGLPAQK